MEDFKYLLDDDEWTHFRRLLREGGDAEALQGFFEAFWAQRDPMPSRAVNVRLAEHYERLGRAERDYAFFGFRMWFNDPDKSSELRFPEAFRLNEEFNDKGLVYIRHGEPGDRIVEVSEGTAPNESWRYGQPRMDFHFVIAEGGSGNNWRLTPRLDPRMLESRAHWGYPYLQAARARSPLDLVEADYRIADRSRESVALGFASESYHWPEDVERFAPAYLPVAFREPDGQTRLEVHFALPADRVSAADASDSLRAEAGVALVGASARPLVEARRTRYVRGVEEGGEAAVGRFVLMPPGGDSLQLSFHLALGPAGAPAQLGVETSAYLPPTFPEGELTMSDVLPARLIRAVERGDTLLRGDRYVLPNPSGVFARGAPVFVYFELYGLALDEAGLSRAAVEVALLPERPRRGFLGLFGRRSGPLLRVRTERAAPGTSSAEHAEIDVASVEPGRYRLQVSVTDLLREQSAERSFELVLEP